ncbi:MAG: peptidyl-prolyl cis-trans isomerase [Janthinobacterium lividum]
MQLTRRRAARLTSLAVLSSLAVVPLVLTGCNHAATNDSGSGGNSITTSGGDSGPVATLTTPKGSTLTLSQTEFYDQLQGFIPNGSPQSFAPVGQPAGRLVIQQLLQNLIFEGLAQDQSVAPTDAEVDQQYANIKMIQEARSTKPFDQALADAGLTPDVFKSLQVKPQLAQLKLLTKGATVSDADIQAFYTANKDKSYTEPARVHIKRIVLATMDQAQQVSKAIAGGQTFESQVAQSLDKSSPDGDVPQWIPLDPAPPSLGALIGPIKTAAVGSVTAPIAVAGANRQSTYWVVKIADRVDKKVVLPLGQVKDLIRAQLLQQKAQSDPTAQEGFQQELRDFQSQVKITTSPQYASVVQALTHPAPPPPTASSPAPGSAPGGSSPFAPAHP